MSTFSGEVRRIQTDGGSHIEPPLDQAWNDLAQLRWQAAVVELDSGLSVSVSRRDRWLRWRVVDSYSIQVGNSGIGDFSFLDAWTFLSGVTIGAHAALDAQNARP